MSQTFNYQRRVEFRDTDMAGIVHFSVFFTYLEEAEHALWRSLGLSVITEFAGQKISWPRVAALCNYRQAIRFEELVDVELSIARIGEKSVTFQGKFLVEGRLVADGHVTAVCCCFDDGSSPLAVEIPQGIRDLLAPFVIKS